jgi:hypothetical protein
MQRSPAGLISSVPGIKIWATNCLFFYSFVTKGYKKIGHLLCRACQSTSLFTHKTTTANKIFIKSDITELYRNKAVPQLKRLVAGFPPRRPRFEPGSSHVGFLVDKVALGQVFSEYFGFPYQSSLHQILHPHYHPGQVQ